MELPERICYENLGDIDRDLKYVKHPWLVLQRSEDQYIFGKLSPLGDIIFKILVSKSLDFKVYCHSALLPSLHQLQKFSLKITRIQWLIKEIDTAKKCEGIFDEELVKYGEIPSKETSKRFYKHVDTKPLLEKQNAPVLYSTCVRSCACLFLSDANICGPCKTVKKYLKQKWRIESNVSKKTLSLSTPLRSAAKKKLINALILSRAKEKSLNERIKLLEKKIQIEGVKLDSDIHNDLQGIIECNLASVNKNSFADLFWKEQVKAFSRSSSGIRWHPMMIRFALHLHLRSPSAYNALRESKVIKLPSDRTLRYYGNIVHPRAGFKKEVFDELKHEIAKYSHPSQMYVTLMFDEMSVKDDLVYDKVTEQLIGFVDVGKNMEAFMKKGYKAGNLVDQVATQVLVLMVCGLTSPVKKAIAYFATQSCSGTILFSLLWKAVGYLETYANVRVIAFASDKASPNQAFYQMHKSEDEEIAYKAKNPFARDGERHIYFFSDAPHLLKTLRNNLANSGSGKKTRLLWNQGHDLLWKHVQDCYEEDTKCQVRKLPKLTSEHIYLNSYSVMRVNLAAQVMSHSVSRVMESYCPAESFETAKFIALVDKFFDCMNSRSLNEAERKRKPFLAPYKSIDDPRFDFLERDFLGYMDKWKTAVETRKGKFSNAERAKMFISQQTYDGIRVSIHSLVECTKYLLENGLQYVLSSKFNQDPLEQHFGRHRMLARRSTNPTIQAYGFQERRLSLQSSLALTLTPRGNVRGLKRRAEGITICTSPLKRKK